MPILRGSRRSQCRLYTVHSQHWERRLQQKIIGVRKWKEVGKRVTDFALRFMPVWGEVDEPFVNFALKVMRAWCEVEKRVVDFSSG